MPPLPIPSPQSVYRGNYASLPAATLKPPVEGNRTVPVSINWSTAGLSPNYCVQFNARHQQTLAINQIAAIHVDNSKCSSSMHIAFLDTQFEILIGPNAVGFYPVVTNSLEFFAWIDLQPSGQDTTILQVLNFLPPPILFGTQLGGTGVGTVREVDTAAPIVGGPITDQGTIGLSTPLAVNFGGTAGVTGNAALDNLSGASGATTGSLSRSGTGVWSITSAGSGTITGVTAGNGLSGGGTSGTVSLALNAPVSIANGGTAATTGNAALDSLSNQSGSNAGVLQRSSGGGWATLLPLPINIGSGGTGASSATAALANLGAAPLASPVFTGAPQVPTATPATTSTAQAASTQFVQQAIAATPGKIPTVQRFLSGTGTYTPAANVAWIRVRMVAGGGGGGGAVGGTNGGAGTNTTFGGWTTIAGGGGGGGVAPPSSAAGGTGGGAAASGGNGTGTLVVRLSGGQGQVGSAPTPTGASFTGVYSYGAGSVWGALSAYGVVGGSPLPGGGGPGAASNNGGATAGGGGGGGEYAEFLVNAPGALAYSVGTAGTAGGGGLSGFVGQPGIIVVEEHY